MIELELVPSSFFHPDPYPRLWNWEDLKQVVGTNISQAANHLRSPNSLQNNPKLIYLVVSAQILGELALDPRGELEMAIQPHLPTLDDV